MRIFQRNREHQNISNEYYYSIRVIENDWLRNEPIRNECASLTGLNAHINIFMDLLYQLALTLSNGRQQVYFLSETPFWSFFVAAEAKTPVCVHLEERKPGWVPHNFRLTLSFGCSLHVKVMGIICGIRYANFVRSKKSKIESVSWRIPIG